MTGVIWNIDQPLVRAVLIGVSLLGWFTVFYSSFLIDHFDLFGLRQVFLSLLGKEYTSPPLATPTLYRIIRHPILLGWMIVLIGFVRIYCRPTCVAINKSILE
ncbi:MAG: hypothetical protein IH805_09390, partial [Proteobacteria bacterium]|nr:hypothetical protein [Pseudomonadota bacterium]